VVEPGNEPTPALMPDRSVEAPFLRDPNAGLIKRPAGGAGHRPDVEVLNSNRLEPAGQIGRRLLDPVASPVCFARFEFRDRQLRPLTTVGAILRPREVSLQPAEPVPFTGSEARGVQQVPSGQCHRHRHTAIDTDHATVPWTRDRVGNVRESDIPATSTITSDTVGLDVLRYGPRPAEPDPADLRYPNPAKVLVELSDMARFHPDLAKAFMDAGLAPRWTAMSAGEVVLHGLREISQRLLLHCLRPGRQPVVFAAGFGQLRRLLVVCGGGTARPPILLLFHGKIPDKSCMPAMFQQFDPLSGCWQQSKPRHTRNLAAVADIRLRPKTSPSQAEAIPICLYLPLSECQNYRPVECK